MRNSNFRTYSIIQFYHWCEFRLSIFAKSRHYDIALAQNSYRSKDQGCEYENKYTSRPLVFSLENNQPRFLFIFSIQ